MGLNQGSHENKVFLSITNGKLAKRVQEGTPGAVEREIEYPKGTPKRMIHEMLYKDLTAKIDNVEIKEGGEFGDKVEVTLKDVADVFTLSLALKSKEGGAFMKCLPNIILHEEVTLEPYNYSRKKDGKKMIGLGIVQGGEKVKFYYSAANGMPDSPEDSSLDKDEFMILMAQQTVFLKKKTKAFIAENFKAAPAPTHSHQEPSHSPFSQEKNEDWKNISDDLPF